MNKNSIKEDIKIVENYLANSAINETDSNFFKNGGWETVDLEIPKSMQHILSDYKRVLKENEELKKFITEGITIEPNSPYKNYQLDFLRKNFIPVKKVKDKIEEEKIPLTIVGGRKNKKTLEYGIKLGRRHVLQELLEGRK